MAPNMCKATVFGDGQECNLNKILDENLLAPGSWVGLKKCTQSFQVSFLVALWIDLVPILHLFGNTVGDILVTFATS